MRDVRRLSELLKTSDGYPGFNRENSHVGNKPSRNQDRARVAAGQDHEVRYEAEKKGVTKGQVKDAVKAFGNSRKNVEKKLKGK